MQSTFHQVFVIGCRDEVLREALREQLRGLKVKAAFMRSNDEVLDWMDEVPNRHLVFVLDGWYWFDLLMFDVARFDGFTILVDSIDWSDQSQSMRKGGADLVVDRDAPEVLFQLIDAMARRKIV